MKAASARFQFPVNYHFTDEVQSTSDPALVYEDSVLQVQAFPLRHRIPCCGFLFTQQQKERTYLPEVGAKYHLPYAAIAQVKKGADYVTPDGRRIPNSTLTAPPAPPRVYAFCTDTRPLDSTIEFVRGVHCLYHEGTFMEQDAQRANDTFHSTAREAAELARKAEVGKLLLGHFSARYKVLDGLLDEARAVFPDTLLAQEGKRFAI